MSARGVPVVRRIGRGSQSDSQRRMPDLASRASQAVEGVAPRGRGIGRGRPLRVSESPDAGASMPKGVIRGGGRGRSMRDDENLMRGAFSEAVLGTRRFPNSSNGKESQGRWASRENGRSSSAGTGLDGSVQDQRAAFADFEDDYGSQKGFGAKDRRRGKARGPLRQQKSGDWFSSASRVEALKREADVQKSKEAEAWAERLARAASAQSGEGDDILFAGGNFRPLVVDLPESHWATSYLKGIGASLQANHGIAPSAKHRIIDETVAMLKEFGSHERLVAEAMGNRAPGGDASAKTAEDAARGGD